MRHALTIAQSHALAHARTGAWHAMASVHQFPNLTAAQRKKARAAHVKAASAHDKAMHAWEAAHSDEKLIGAANWKTVQAGMATQDANVADTAWMRKDDAE